MDQHSLMLYNPSYHLDICQSHQFLLDQRFLRESPKVCQKSESKTELVVENTDSECVETEYINDPFFCTLTKNHKFGKDLISSKGEICFMKTSSGQGNRISTRHHSISAIPSALCFSLNDSGPRLEVIGEAIFYMIFISTKTKKSVSSQKASKMFNDPIFKHKNFEMEKIRVQTISPPHCIYQLRAKKDEKINLSLKEINKFLHQLYTKMRIEDQILVQMLYYLIKIVRLGEVYLTAKNWKPLVLTSLNLSAKFLYDTWYKNKDFVQITGLYTLKRFNGFERRFVKEIRYELFSQPEHLAKLQTDPVKYISALCPSQPKTQS
ncbi:unnamed protein product [Moneuplotes crassus]|uniref:Cyclin N-terminal domain-containing protein n=1 Tax=Euplotes crassus TaxID=5936 RepID=A0AAD2DAN0_EUPCR|nr:unnamed protein product [Moneuplotes crassus]